MTDTEPRGSDAEIVALLRGCGMDEVNLDEGVRNVREILRAKTAAVTDTEPLDLDALIEDADDYATALDYAGRSEGVRVIRGLIAEVRRLREEKGDWEYSVDYSVPRGGSHVSGWTGWCTSDLAEAKEWASARLDGRVLRRHKPGPAEEVIV